MRATTFRKVLPTLVATAFLGSLVALGASSQTEISKSELAARGKVTYRVYCSNCHGPTAKGDGPLASLLKTEPADLTHLTGKSGKFEAEAVKQRIDGRESIAAHGYGEMPVWGLSFQNLEKGGDQEPDIQARLNQLVAFLESIQTPAKP